MKVSTTLDLAHKLLHFIKLVTLMMKYDLDHCLL